MNILLLNAGAKNYGATQEILQTIRETLEPKHQVKLTGLGEKELKFCKGCKVCYETNQCAQEDDVAAIIQEMNEADILIIAAPSYWADVPGQFKVFIDRCTVYSNTNPNPEHPVLKSGKKCYGIALRTGLRPMECEHIIETIAHWCGHMEIEMSGSMYFCGINDEKDIQQHKAAIAEQAQKWVGSI